MNQPPGPPYGPPPGGPPSGWPPPPGGPPPYGPPPPGGPPSPSRLRPPWRDADPAERGLIVLWTVIGFLLPWVVLALGVVLAILGHPLPSVICIGLAIVLDVAGFIVMMVANHLQVRGAAYGSFAGCLTHVITVAVAVLIFFGWCVSMLNGVG